EVAHHAAHGQELLRVLLTEQRDVGPYQVHELEHHGEHAVQVPGPVLALQHLADVPGRHAHHRVAVRVDDVGRGREHDVGPDARELGDVALEVTRVPVQVLALPELQRVDEDRDDHLAV